MKKWTGLLVCSLLVAGCATLDQPQQRTIFELEEGARLSLKVPLTIPANTASVAIRDDGSLWPAAARYAPNCIVQVEQPKAQPQRIEPGDFRVGRSFQHEDHMSCGNHIFATTMYLNSEEQPFVRSITCQIWDGYAAGSFLTAQQIEQTLASVFELR
ncbi:MAG: hypothetical protein PVI15_04270 [Chromatiales bacterium]